MLADPDDFRQVFVDDGDDRPLVPLTEEFADESTPAYSFKDAENLRKASKEPPPGADTRQKFRGDVQARAIESTPARTRKKTKAERNKDVADRSRADQAVRRAVAAPLATAVSQPHATAPATPTMEIDDVAPLPVRSRSRGEVRG